MKNKLKKQTAIITIVFASFCLSGCSIYDLFGGADSGNLITADKTISSYDYSTRTADKSGTNYSSQTSKYTQAQLNASSDSFVLNSTGTQNILVIPVEIKGYTSVCTETTRNNIYKTFFGASSDTGWESLASYYAKSSYGNLLLNGTVSDWYECGYTVKELANLTSNNSSYDATWTILENAVTWYEKKYNTTCSEFDNDNDGLIDGVWLVYSAPHYDSSTNNYTDENQQNLMWAYTFSDYSVSSYYTNAASSVKRVGFHYCWASYDFMYEGYGNSKLDAHTYIHETGHLMGLDDYYVASSVKNTVNYAPMGCIDMMDYNIIDHNAYSKFALGWVHPYVVTGSATITLEPSSTTGQCILIPAGDSWNGSAFDEYILMEYYTPTGLNQKDSESNYSGAYPLGFTENGVRIYHVDARMINITYNNGNTTGSYGDSIVTSTTSSSKYTYTMTAHSNSNDYNVVNRNYRLIQEMDCTNKNNFDTTYDTTNKHVWVADNSTLFQDGDTFTYSAYKKSFPNYWYNNTQTMNNGNKFTASVSFSNMSDSGITVTITA